MPSHSSIRSVVAGAGLLGVALALPACALVEPPTAQLAVARAAIADAEAADAAARAPGELASARDKLAQAEARVRRGHNDEAGLLADQAAADARLAIMKARAAAATTALTVVRQNPAGAPVDANTR